MLKTINIVLNITVMFNFELFSATVIIFYKYTTMIITRKLLTNFNVILHLKSYYNTQFIIN